MMPRQFACQLPVVAVIAGLSACTSPPKSTDLTHTYSLGERVYLGHLVYQVIETRWMPELDPGGGSDPRIPQSRFFLVRLDATNNAPEKVIVPNAVLEDDKGNTYQELKDGTGVPMWPGYLRPLGSNETMRGNLVFDVPPRHYKIRLFDEDSSTSSLVELPLQFETPDTPNQ